MADIENPSTLSSSLGGTMSRPTSGPMMNKSRPVTQGSGGILRSRPTTGGSTIWTVEGDDKLEGLENQGYEGDLAPQSISPSINSDNGLTEEDTRILLEKEFDDYHEDRVHKSAGPMIFLAKTVSMLPCIWTDDEPENECKAYFNLYTFVVFLSFYAMAIASGFRINLIGREITWPDDEVRAGNETISERRFFSRLIVDGYAGCLFTNAIVSTSWTIFKCTRFAEMLYTISQVDGQLELKEKHYEKIKTKTTNWISLEIILTASHLVGLIWMLESIRRDMILYVCFFLGNLPVAVLDIVYSHLCIVLCKRYRMLNKIMAHITTPFRTFRMDNEPSHEMLQKILSYRWEAVKKEEASKTFDQIWEPSGEDNANLPDDAGQNKVDMGKLELPPAALLKGADKEISREEETTVILQLDILRGIHSDLHHVGQEINNILGFQILITLVTNVVLVVIFGFFTVMTALDRVFYWPFLCIVLTPALRILFIGHWAQVMKETSMKPFWTMSQMSTLDGSPKLERQVQKINLQTAQKTASISAAGYFTVTRNTITRILGLVALFIFLLVKFDRLGINVDTIGFTFNMTGARIAVSDGDDNNWKG